MAEAAIKNEYYRYSTYVPQAETGSVAENKVVARPKPIAIPRPSVRPRISAFSILGFVFVAALAVICMLSYIELTRISAEITGVKAVPPRIAAREGIRQKLEEQTALNNALRVEYERAFDLKQIENYAINNLGMIKQNVTTTNNESGVLSDKGVIPAAAQNKGGIKTFLKSLGEYF